jgi:hypothetical protein
MTEGKTEEKEVRKPFQSDDVIDDLMGYARKLQALGEVWGTLSWHEGAGKANSNTLENCGEELGNIIRDYAEAIEIIFENIQCLLVERDKNIVFPIADYQHAFEWLSKTPGQQDISLVGYYLEGLNKFMQNEVMPLFDLRKKYEDLLKEKQKSTPATVSAAAGA